ncbi:MAG: ATP-binding cassette domain-containing protein [Clostridia bacterium]|nr:ATP-binding cassette domain-containing protein [Clostridia bacterium]
MIEIKHLNKTFHLKTGDVAAVKDVSLTIGDGEIYGVIGYSGAGKSTLVRCINLLEIPDSGQLSVNDSGLITIDKQRLSCAGRPMGEKQLCQLRRGIGMIFQHFNLLDRSTVFENIAYPLRYSGMSRQQIRERVYELLELVDLTDKVNVYPSQLSGGQKQRVAIARALANRPSVLLSDEATSALDPDATEAILNLLKDLNRKLGLTIVLITHEMAVIKSICQKVAVMEDGAVVEEGNVYDIFANPRQRITRRFVGSASPLAKVDKLIAGDSPLVRTSGGEKLIRLTFGKDCVGESVISEVSRRFSVNLNIVLANVEVLQGNPLGGMIAVISGSDDHVADALAYLEQNHVITEVIDRAAVH